jgi:hypothetical protein
MGRKCHLTVLARMSSAACCNEAFKLATTSAPSLDNYTMVSFPRSRFSLANHALMVMRAVSTLATTRSTRSLSSTKRTRNVPSAEERRSTSRSKRGPRSRALSKCSPRTSDCESPFPESRARLGSSTPRACLTAKSKSHRYRLVADSLYSGKHHLNCMNRPSITWRRTWTS